MKQLSAFLIFILLSANSFSQDYKTIRPERIVHFESLNNSKTIASIRIDSIYQYGDTLNLFNNYMIRPLEYTGYYTLSGDSWLGRKVSVLPDGTNLFFNKDQDTIVIKTNALLDDCWTLYQFEDSRYIEASIDNINTMSFLGITDSVKTITLQLYDENDYAIENELNDFYLLLSKNYGLIRIFDFYNFPIYNYDYFNYGISKELEIIGMTNPDLGWQNIITEDVFDFNIGDEFHMIDVYDQYFGWERTFKKIMKSIMDKNISANGDTLEYLQQVCKRIETTDSENETTIYTSNQEEIEKIYLSNYSFLNKLPLEPANYHGFITFYYKYDSLIKGAPMMFAVFENDSVLEMVYDLYDWHSYYKGKGVFHYWINMFNDESYSELVYYKKGNEEWGTPYICDSLLVKSEEVENINKQIVIYPNPVTDYMQIEFNSLKHNNLKIEIYDYLGKLLLSELIDNSEKKIDISHLPDFILLIKILNRKGNVLLTEKLMKY